MRLLFLLAFAAIPLGSSAIATNAQDSTTTVWEAEFFPVSVTYDEQIWGNRSTSSFDSNERFQIVARPTAFTMQLFDHDTFDGEACLVDYIATISKLDGVSNFADAESLDLPTGLPDAAEALVIYDFQWPGREETVAMVQHLSCLEIEPGRLMLIGIETRAGIYNEEIEIIDGILAGVEIAS